MPSYPKTSPGSFRKRRWSGMVLAGALLAGIASACAGTRTTGTPVGPFELMVERRTTRLQLFNPNGPLAEWKPQHHERYWLKHRGKRFRFHAPGGPFGGETTTYGELRIAWILPAQEPALLVLVGEQNRAYWHLIREVDGRPRAEPLATEHGGHVTGTWLDAASPVDEVESPGTRRLRQAAGHVAGGRLLMLGHDSVLDVQTLQHHRLQLPAEIRFQFQQLLGLSPDGSALARYAERRGRDEAVIVAHSLATGAATVLPIDRSRMRYRQASDIDAAWLAHHYQWRGDVLAQRPGFVPLPYKGYRGADRHGRGDDASYQLDGVDIAFGAVVGRVLADGFHARYEPNPRPELAAYAQQAPYGRYRIGSHVLNLDWVAGEGHRPDRLLLWSEPGTRQGVAPLIAGISDAIDAELASHRHDALFAPPDDARHR